MRASEDPRLGDPVKSVGRGFGRWLITVVVFVVAGCGGVDADQVRACQRLIPALEHLPETVEIVRNERHGSADNAVIVYYRSRNPLGATAEHSIACWFEGGAFGLGRLTLHGVSTDGQGLLSPVQFEMLQLWLRIYGNRIAALGPPPAKAAGPPLDHPLYLFQQLINAAPVACIYILIAIGFSLVYGMIGRINLAFGEMATIAAYTAFLLVSVLTMLGADGFGLGLLAAAAAAIAVAAMYGLVTERTVFRPLRESGTQAPLIATVGLAMFLRELMRLAEGSRDRWLAPLITEPYVLAAGDGATVSISAAQLVILLFTAIVVACVLSLVARSRFGRAFRACSDDVRTARLMGIDVDRTVMLAFVLGAGCAGAAGVVVVLYYGTVSAYMGMMLGFKGLVAAVVGGFGSLAGAIAGGIIVALLETLWSGYLVAAYRDVAVFGLLAMTLVFRPEGLLGRTSNRGD